MDKTPILYSLTPADPAAHLFHVSLTVDQPDEAGQKLWLPAWIPGSYLVRDFSRQIITIEAQGNGEGVTITKTGNHTWQCDPCQGPLRVEYTVYAWDLSVRSAHFDETHAFFNGTSVFLAVSGQEDRPCQLQLLAPPHTKDWKVYTSLREARTDGAARHGFGLYEAENYDALIDHPVEMGVPQVARFEAHGAEHELVFTGVAPNLDMDRIAADVKKICEAQIEFFEPDTKRAPFLDSSDRYVFMTMVTGDGYGGLEHRSSTALMAARKDLPTLGQEKAPSSYETFLGLVSHEYFHTWNVKRIKPAVFAPYDLMRENHTRLLWVFEGFTSYYDDLMLLRAQVISLDDYLRLLSKVIGGVHRTSGRLKQSVAESSFDTWTRFYKQDENSPNALVSYYSKGSLVALGLDITIRERSGDKYSLDDVMRYMWNRYGRDFYQGAPRGINEDSMADIVREATGVDTSDFIQRYAYGREDLPLAQLLDTQGVELTWASAGSTVSLDARLKVTPGQVELATVFEGGAAHRGGLSAGDVLVAVDGLRVSDALGLEHILRAYKAGDTVQVHVFRRDELRQFTVPLSPPPNSECRLAVKKTSAPELVDTTEEVLAL